MGQMNNKKCREEITRIEIFENSSLLLLGEKSLTNKRNQRHILAIKKPKSYKNFKNYNRIMLSADLRNSIKTEKTSFQLNTLLHLLKQKI